MSVFQALDKPMWKYELRDSIAYIVGKTLRLK